MRFGIGFHNTPGRTWGQFMPVRYTSDKRGAKQGGRTMRCRRFWMARENGGREWIRSTYTGRYIILSEPLHSPFANQFMWRVDDAITKYHPGCDLF